MLSELGRGLPCTRPEPTRDIAAITPAGFGARTPHATAEPSRFKSAISGRRLGLSFPRRRRSRVPRNRSSGQRASDSALEAAERDYADRFERATGARVDRFERIDDWKSAIASSRAIVAPDSGALHVAGTIGTPVVAVFPDSPQFELQTARWHPWAAPVPESCEAIRVGRNASGPALYELTGGENYWRHASIRRYDSTPPLPLL